MNTTTRGVMLLSAMLLAGCASQPTASQAPISPTCAVADCEVKWAAARTFVINHAGMKLQTYSADYMQTLAGRRFDGAGGRSEQAADPGRLCHRRQVLVRQSVRLLSEGGRDSEGVHGSGKRSRALRPSPARAYA